MSVLDSLQPARVFHYFREICAIPHGSQNMDAIAAYCVNFAQTHNLRYVRDAADNVIIYKPASVGYEDADPLILQGHLDMVCQQDEGRSMDFSRDGLELFVDGDQLGARGTTLGADNGIAVAMILAVLEQEDLPHPPLEAVLTSDEEIGMIGAGLLDMTLLKGRKMINLDAEEDDTLTVSCAGGSDVCFRLPYTRESMSGVAATVTLKGLQGGHSGVEIDKGRVNADILAGRFLHHMRALSPYGLMAVYGGDKGNAIPHTCRLTLCLADPEAFVREANAYTRLLKEEIAAREPSFAVEIEIDESCGTHSVIAHDAADKLITTLVCAPNGIMDMSAQIQGLVETSLNLGILSTEDDHFLLHFTLRSNKRSALTFLEERLKAFAACIPCRVEAFGHYPPWEFKNNSALQALYKRCFEKQYGHAPKVEAIHAGLECGLFASKLPDLDCIAIGPQLSDVHTTKERLCISSAAATYRLLLELLKQSR